MAKEQWRPVVGWEGLYEVSDRGRVKSLERRVRNNKSGGTRLVPGRLLSLVDHAGGYKMACLKETPRKRMYLVSHLVAGAFIGPRPPGMYVLHGPDGCKNDAVTNLSYGTPTQNSEDQIRDGTRLNGERHGRSKLTAKQVERIRTLALTTNLTQQRIADKFGVSQTAIHKIIRGHKWKHTHSTN